MRLLNELTVDINNSCKLRCLHCSNPMTSKAPFLEYESMRNILDEFFDLGGAQINISGGEPLLHESVYDIVKYSSQLGIYTTIYTTGIIDRNVQISTADIVAERLAGAGLSCAYLSLHGSCSAVHDTITNLAGSFEYTVALGRSLRKNGVDVIAHCVPLRINVFDLDRYSESIWSYDFNGIRFLRYVTQGRGITNNDILVFNESELDSLIRELKKIHDMCPNGRTVTFGGFTPYFPCRTYYKDGNICQAGIHFLHILASGLVTPCPAFKEDERFFLGDIRTSSLRASLDSYVLASKNVGIETQAWCCPAHVKR